MVHCRPTGAIPDAVKLTPTAAAVPGFTTAEEILRLFVCATDAQLNNTNKVVKDKADL